MGRRGPKLAGEVQGEYASAGATLSARLTTPTQQRLKEAARANHQTVTRELESRLVRSFLADNTFGNIETDALLRLVAALTKSTRELTGESWRRDRFTHDLTVEAIRILLDALAPPGDGALPESFPNYFVGFPPEPRDSLRQFTMQALTVARQDTLRTWAMQITNRVIAQVREGSPAPAEQDVYEKIAVALAAAYDKHQAQPRERKQAQARARRSVEKLLKRRSK